MLSAMSTEIMRSHYPHHQRSCSTTAAATSSMTTGKSSIIQQQQHSKRTRSVSPERSAKRPHNLLSRKLSHSSSLRSAGLRSGSVDATCTSSIISTSTSTTPSSPGFPSLLTVASSLASSLRAARENNNNNEYGRPSSSHSRCSSSAFSVSVSMNRDGDNLSVDSTATGISATDDLALSSRGGGSFHHHHTEYYKAYRNQHQQQHQYHHSTHHRPSSLSLTSRVSPPVNSPNSPASQFAYYEYNVNGTGSIPQHDSSRALASSKRAARAMQAITNYTSQTQAPTAAATSFPPAIRPPLVRHSSSDSQSFFRARKASLGSNTLNSKVSTPSMGTLTVPSHDMSGQGSTRATSEPPMDAQIIHNHPAALMSSGMVAVVSNQGERGYTKQQEMASDDNMEEDEPVLYDNIIQNWTEDDDNMVSSTY